MLGEKKEEPAFFHLQKSFPVDDVIEHVAAYFGINQNSVLTRKSGHREARRLAMYCVCSYCLHNHTLSELARFFSLSAIALTQANVINSSSPSVKKSLQDLKKMITKT